MGQKNICNIVYSYIDGFCIPQWTFHKGVRKSAVISITLLPDVSNFSWLFILFFISLKFDVFRKKD